MLILALDTTSEHGGVALYRDAECLVSVLNAGPANKYSVTLFEMVDQAFAELRTQNSAPCPGLRDVELFAAANGPGSFTGIRVGLAAAQGWAKAFDRPVKGVSVLGAMAEEARPETAWAVPIMDARRKEFFLGVYRRPPGQVSFQAHGDGLVLKLSDLQSLVEGLISSERGRTITCLVREPDQSAAGLRENLPGALHWQTVPGPVLGAIARLAFRAAKDGKLESPAELDGCYIRRPDAESLFQRVEEKG